MQMNYKTSSKNGSYLTVWQKFVTLIAIIASIFCGFTQAQIAQKKKQSSSRPNIVFIMSDDHSYDAIRAYNGPLAKIAPTPNIDKIAKGGIIYKKAFVENSLCTPSRACLMT